MLVGVFVLAFYYSSASAAFGDELQGFWKLDDGSGGTALDSSGNANHGTLVGNPLWTGEGIGGSLNLDGNGDYVTVGVGSQYSDLCINGCSFGGWIKPNGQPAASRTFGIIGRYDYTDADMFFRLAYNRWGKLFAFMSYDGTVTNRCRATSGYDFAFDRWQHVFVVFDGSTLKLYLDGVEEGSADCGFVGIDAAAWQDPESTFLGAFDSSDTQGEINAALDEIAMFNRGLSPAEVLDIYTNGVDAGPTGDPDPIDDPPILSNGVPAGNLPSGTSVVVLGLSTNENATCKYGTVSNVDYDSMANTFVATGGLSHSQSLSGMTEGSHRYYVRCEDAETNANTQDYLIRFVIGDSLSPIYADLYVDFEAGSVGDPFTVGYLNSSTYGSGATWINRPAQQFTVGSEHRQLDMPVIVEGTTYQDTGTRGLRFDHVLPWMEGSDVYSQMDLPSSYDSLSLGVFLKYTVSGYRFYDFLGVTNSNGQASCMVNFAEDNIRAHGAQPETTRGSNIPVVPGTWYWVNLKWVRNDQCYVNVYSADDGSLLGTSAASPITDYPVNRVHFELTYNDESVSDTYYDNLVIDWTNADFPLGVPGTTGTPAPNNPPAISISTEDITTSLTPTLALSGTVTDNDGPLEEVILTWSMSSGPGTVAITDPNTADTTATFSAIGEYVIQLQADDGEDTSTQTLTVNISGPSVSVSVP